MAEKELKIHDFCGDYALDITYFNGGPITLYFNSRRNAENVKRIIEVDGSVPNKATVCDMQEVRHASWVKNQEDMYWGNYFIRRQCSICGGSPFYHEGLGTYKLTPYCPYCGAKMDKE